jgi:uncharacterized protein YjbI with pentapeptide repeats
VLIFLNNGWGGPDCANTLQNPRVILVAPGFVVLFISERQPSEFLLPWGGVNVRISDPAPVIVPPDWRDRWVSTNTLVEVRRAFFSASTWQSCRGCDLSGQRVSFSPSGVDPSRVVTAFDFSGANFRGATLSGAAPGYDFSRADFRGATFTAGLNFNGATFDRALLPTSLFQQLLLTANVHFSRSCPSSPSSCGAHVVASVADRRVLAGADLSSANLAGVQFVGEALDLTGTKFDLANLTGTGLGLARLAGASFASVTAPQAAFHYADLSGDPGGSLKGADFQGQTRQTNLQGANFVNADVSGASFIGTDLTGADFTAALAVDTDFSGVKAPGAKFPQAHIYGSGNAFNTATDLNGIDFIGAVLAGVSVTGGFDLSSTQLNDAKFDGAVCVNCKLASAQLERATFTGAYLPGVVLSSATLTDASFDRAWLYCGGPTNPNCASETPDWDWPLALGSPEVFGPVKFGAPGLSGTSFDHVTCPDGTKGASDCLQRIPSESFAFPPCSAAGRSTCPTTTSSLWPPPPLLDTGPRPLAIVATAPPTWNTTLSNLGYYVAFDDATIRLISGSEPPTIVAGTPAVTCADPTSLCGDGGLATAALLGQPTGLAVGLDGSLYIADAGLLRVRVIDPSGVITTVAGTGLRCPSNSTCGDGGPATQATLGGAQGVAVDTNDVLLIADGTAGARRVDMDRTISTLARGTVVSIVTSPDGPLYAATSSPDLIIQIDPNTGTVTPVVGTGVSGYNGNSDDNGFLPGTRVQVNEPSGLAVDLHGHVLFADTGNHLIRAYLPSNKHVIDDLAGHVTDDGTPQGGFNHDGCYASDTLLNRPRGVAATRTALLVVADTDNGRVRHVGPGLRGAKCPPAPTREVVVSCRAGQTSTCRRLFTPAGPVATKTIGAVTISHEGVVFATGRAFLPVQGRLRLHLTEHHPLVPGRYDLVIAQAGPPQTQTIWLDQAPDVIERRP